MACYVATKTQNFDLPFSWITLIQEGFQITLIRSGTDIVLPPSYQATTVPGSSTPKNGSGAEIGASSKSCSLVDDGSGIVLLESEVLWVPRLSNDRVPISCSVMELPSICADGSDTGSSPCSEGFVPLNQHEALTSCFWVFDATIVMALDFVLLFVVVTLTRGQLWKSAVCSMGLFLLGCSSSCSVLLLYAAWSTIGGLCFILIEAGIYCILWVQAACPVFSCRVLLLAPTKLDGAWILHELCLGQVLLASCVKVGLALWFLVAAFAELGVLLHLTGVTGFIPCCWICRFGLQWSSLALCSWLLDFMLAFTSLVAAICRRACVAALCIFVMLSFMHRLRDVSCCWFVRIAEADGCCSTQHGLLSPGLLVC
ncbi:hypothetical protein NC651_006953 [Populus alba x Populus x berolinensis]|nr:hypothetical protein NC651_006953 [Populus alba x Populus x berolinensis]